MKWLFLSSGSNSGKFNMETDLFLATNCEPDEAVFRLYKWQPFCISLGANQNDNIIDYTETRKDGIDVVKRPTGGRAILHAEEITYSLIYPVLPVTSAKELYFNINSALKKGLEKFDEKLHDIELEDEQQDFSKLYKDSSGSICFAASAKNELKYKGKKLVGSAQRKFKNSILQHGSILCGGFHTNITKYLKIPDKEKRIIEAELNEKTIDLSVVLKGKVDYETLSESLILGFQEYFKITDLQYV